MSKALSLKGLVSEGGLGRKPSQLNSSYNSFLIIDRVKKPRGFFIVYEEVREWREWTVNSEYWISSLSKVITIVTNDRVVRSWYYGCLDSLSKWIGYEFEDRVLREVWESIRGVCHRND